MWDAHSGVTFIFLEGRVRRVTYSMMFGHHRCVWGGIQVTIVSFFFQAIVSSSPYTETYLCQCRPILTLCHIKNTTYKSFMAFLVLYYLLALIYTYAAPLTIFSSIL